MPKLEVPDVKTLGGETQTQSRFCDMPGCTLPAEYPAPKSRSELRDYIWFCLDHVRDYNKGWNYYKGLQGAALEAEMKRATTWERPSWKFGTRGTGPQNTGRIDEDIIGDVFGFFGTAGQADSADQLAGLDKEERAAWRLFDMSPTDDMAMIKKRYNELAKRYHPDSHPEDPAAEERFKEINLAYSVLRKKRLNPLS